mgnify:CR=1 FL=1
MLKERAFRERNEWRQALEQIAKEVGNDHALYKILGSVAWGRFDGEPTATDSKDNAVFGLGFLQGVRYVALEAARLYNLKGERSLANIHERFDKK